MFHGQLRSRVPATRFRLAWFRHDPLLWRIPVHAADGTALVVGYSEVDSAYVAHRIDATTGATLWTRTLAVGGYGAPAVGGGVAAVLTDHVGVALLNWHDGRQISVYRGTARIRSSITTTDDGFLVSAGDRLWHLDRTGTVQEAGAAPGLTLFGAPVACDEGWASLYARQLEHGVGLVGVARPGGRTGWQTDLAFSPIASSDTSGLVARDGVIYAGVGTAVVALEAASGTIIWRTDVGGVTTRSAPTLGEDYLAVTDLSGHLHAVDLDTGAARWHSNISHEGCWSPPSITASSVTAIGGGLLHVLDIDRGEPLARIPVGHAPYSALTFSADGTGMLGGGDPPYHGLLIGLEPANECAYPQLRKVGAHTWATAWGGEGPPNASLDWVDASVFGGQVVSADPAGRIVLDTGDLISGSYAVPVGLNDGTTTLARLDLGAVPQVPSSVTLEVATAPARDRLHTGAALLAALLGTGAEEEQGTIRAEAERLIAISERQPWDLWRLAARQILHDPPALDPTATSDE